MARRVLPLALLATIVLGGCGYGTAARLSSDQQQARVQFIKSHGDFDDHELSRLCPGLYPSDFNTNTDAGYPKEDSGRTPPRVTQADRAQAAAAGCDLPQPK
ncbi:MAG TPA: hypothetical protein VGM91_00710 [Conexibacter sp.]|jgi:hypothetical protein